MESYILGGLLTIVGYFLKATMDDLKKVKDISYETRNRLNVIENDYLNKHSHLSDKFDELHNAVKDLIIEIKSLTKELNKKKDI